MSQAPWLCLRNDCARARECVHWLAAASAWDTRKECYPDVTEWFCPDELQPDGFCEHFLSSSPRARDLRHAQTTGV